MSNLHMSEEPHRCQVTLKCPPNLHLSTAEHLIQHREKYNSFGDFCAKLVTFLWFFCPFDYLEDVILEKENLTVGIKQSPHLLKC